MRDTGFREIHHGLRPVIPEEVVPGDISLERHLRGRERKRDRPPDTECRDFEILILGRGGEGHPAHLLAEAVTRRMDPAEAGVRFNAVLLGVKALIRAFREHLRDIGVARERVHPEARSDLQRPVSVRGLMRVDDAIGGRRGVPEIRHTVSADVDIVTLPLATSRLVVRCASAEEETEFRARGHIDFRSDEAGIEVAIHVGKPVVEARRAPDSGRPEACRAVRHFRLASFTDPGRLILHRAGECHPVNDAGVPGVKEEVITKRPVGVLHIGFRRADLGVEKGT